jgi:hypothetical protein
VIAVRKPASKITDAQIRDRHQVTLTGTLVGSYSLLGRMVLQVEVGPDDLVDLGGRS